MRDDEVSAAAVTLPSRDVDGDVALLVARCGFVVERIAPADDPREAVLAGHGTRLRLVRAGPVRAELDGAGDGRVTLWSDAAGVAQRKEQRLPGGTVIEWRAEPRLVVPPMPLDAAVTVVDADASEEDWQRGRAGMLYRDLLPGRLGGRVIASHLRIPSGGPVPDYVHFHDVVYQLIYCRSGWVRVVYEDQGEPFVMHEGDCVLQPPGIRHRVIECSDGLEVIEIGCPAEHATFGDAACVLPNGVDGSRVFGRGQRFARCDLRSGEFAWSDATGSGETMDLGLGAATGGLIDALVWRSAPGLGGAFPVLDAGGGGAEFVFGFVLHGCVQLDARDGPPLGPLRAGAAFCLPGSRDAGLAAVAGGSRVLLLRLAATGEA